ncbi:hypothetical protein HYALB_00007722 [Hymenoscyphus albidus]|uniref:Integral membrane bound transporter domain-containing protein n=1 Tax=Hymenoscyphus albidus TaxID=595503 RepID=A0A9N9Q2W5_9HELO|nr:hypothetical protein HYALB_00007722 [Hymenoscyphus albidus]
MASHDPFTSSPITPTSPRDDKTFNTRPILSSPQTHLPDPRSHASGSSSVANAVSNDFDAQTKRRRRLTFTRTGRHEEKADAQAAKHIRLQALNPGTKSSASSIYYGSFNHSPRRSRASSIRNFTGSGPTSPRVSINHSHLQALLQNLNMDLETYGVEETRDGFFDGSFSKPPKLNRDELLEDAEELLPAEFKKKHPLSPKHFLPRQWRDIQSVVRAVTTTRSGIKLAKSFLGFFIAYVLCLIPVVQIWLGRYSYIMVLSTIINHSGRTVGAQFDGAFQTSLGTAAGLGWGAFALWLSNSTSVASRGYGGILAAFLVVFMGTNAALRSYYVRIYQLVLSAGIAVIYTCLADTSQAVAWGKLFDYGIPWLLGQAICLIIACVVLPDAGARPLAVSLHTALGVMQDGLVLPNPNPTALHRKLALTFVNLSQAYRDLTLDFSVSRFPPSDVAALRNLMQAVVRSLLSLRMETVLFDNFERSDFGSPTRGANTPTRGFYTPTPLSPTPRGDDPDSPFSESSSEVFNLHSPSGYSAGETFADFNKKNRNRPPVIRTYTGEKAVRLVTGKLAQPTSKLLARMKSAFERCDAVLMEMSGYRQWLGPPVTVSSDLIGILTKLRKGIIKYDEAEESLMDNPALPPTYSDHPEVVELFLFIHPIRQAARTVEALLVKVMEMQQSQQKSKIYPPSYPFTKGIQRTNAQVRHDRGGVTAGFYFRSQTQLARTMRGMANVYKPLPHQKAPPNMDEKNESFGLSRSDTMGKYEEEEDLALDRNAPKKRKIRYRLWLILHRLQGFEMRFALKVVVVTALLAIPGWLPQTQHWWNRNEAWWAVAMVWIMSHPRVGGNIQDLFTRALCVILGAVWGGLAYGAKNGNPFVMAAFASVYMLPMIYRFTQSSHPRSGIVGCISFVVVSLAAKADEGLPSVAQIAWTRGVAFTVGVVAAVVVSWVLWPFVARHELRKALAANMVYMSIIYRGVVAKYVYYEKGNEPGVEDVRKSEMLEGRLREGFVRIRQLMALTRHEIRLRGPFDPLPYSALIDASERFFEYLVSVRQSSLFFHPHYISNNDQAAETLLNYRRDAVAAILMNLYVLAGALRGGRKVPRYLPSPALARKNLLDKMAEVEADSARDRDRDLSSPIDDDESSSPVNGVSRWSMIYSYSYSRALTGCVRELEALIFWSKEVLGEMGFDPNGADNEYGIGMPVSRA